jgi:hypothetical protein
MKNNTLHTQTSNNFSPVIILKPSTGEHLFSANPTNMPP